MVSTSQGKFGKYFTLQIVTDLSKSLDPEEKRRELRKGDYSFVDEVFDLYMRHQIGAVGFHPQKTSIGMQVLMRDYDLNSNDYERKLGQWAISFSQLMSGLLKSKVKYFELRPYSYAPV